MSLALCQPAYECTSTSADINVDSIELAGELGKSSMADEAFLVAINEVHAIHCNCQLPAHQRDFDAAKPASKRFEMCRRSRVCSGSGGGQTTSGAAKRGPHVTVTAFRSRVSCQSAGPAVHAPAGRGGAWDSDRFCEGGEGGRSSWL